VEVLSPTTEEMDLNVKLSEYGALASLRAYIVASQDEARCWVWLRAVDKSIPELPEEISGLGRSIDIAALGLTVPLEEIYRGVVHNDEVAEPKP
jgi:Uma2 family endonuclease